MATDFQPRVHSACAPPDAVQLASVSGSPHAKPKKLKKSQIEMYSKPYLLEDGPSRQDLVPPREQWLTEDQRRARISHLARKTGK